MKKRHLKLYLDDVRIPVDKDWIVASNYKEFVHIVRLNGLDSFYLISLDHDLGQQAMKEYFENVRPNYKLNYDNILEETGMDAAKFLVNMSINTNIDLPEITVHSANPIGSANIMGYINNFLKNSKKPQNCIRVQIPHVLKHQQNEKN
jgi:hypothetical protein